MFQTGKNVSCPRLPISLNSQASCSDLSSDALCTPHPRPGEQAIRFNVTEK